MTETATQTKRPRKSSAEKATEALKLAKGRAERAERNLKAAESALEGAKAEQSQAQQYLAYASQHPDLPQVMAEEVTSSDSFGVSVGVSHG